MRPVWRDIASRANVSLRLALLLEAPNQWLSLAPASLRWLTDRDIRLDLEIFAADETDLELSRLKQVPGSTH